MLNLMNAIGTGGFRLFSKAGLNSGYASWSWYNAILIN